MDSIKNKNEELREIFKEFKDSNMESYEKLYTKYHSLVYGVVFTVLKNEENTEDVTQEVFTKLYKMNKEKLPTKGELSWLYTVSKNEALGFLRRKKEDVNIDDIYEAGEESDEIQKIIDIDTYNNIISGLTEEEKEIVSLKILSKFTFKKIGQMLSMPTPTVQWKYYKAVDSLKISIGNMALFVITSVILFVRNIKNSRKKYINMDSSSCIDAEDKSETIKDNSKKSMNNTQESQEEKKSYDKIHNASFSNELSTESGHGTSVQYNIEYSYFWKNSSSVILMGCSGLFLIISIIFAIFYKKYQQKRKKKTSK